MNQSLNFIWSLSIAVKVTDGKCPHCEYRLETPVIDIDQELNCPDCGRLLMLPGDKALSSSSQEAVEKSVHVEVFLILTLLTVFITMFKHVFLNLGLALILILIMAVLYAHDKTADLLPETFAKMIEPSIERLKIYPYEGFLMLGWLVLIALRLTNSFLREPLAYLLVFLALWFCFQARTLYRESRVILEKKKFTSLADVIKSIFSAKFRRQLKQRRAAELAQAKEHFKEAAKEQELIRKKENDLINEESQERIKVEKEMHKWQNEVQNRYKDWMDEEKDRFQ